MSTYINIKSKKYNNLFLNSEYKELFEQLGSCTLEYDKEITSKFNQQSYTNLISENLGSFITEIETLRFAEIQGISVDHYNKFLSDIQDLYLQLSNSSFIFDQKETIVKGDLDQLYDCETYKELQLKIDILQNVFTSYPTTYVDKDYIYESLMYYVQKLINIFIITTIIKDIGSTTKIIYN